MTYGCGSFGPRLASAAIFATDPSQLGWFERKMSALAFAAASRKCSADLMYASNQYAAGRSGVIVKLKPVPPHNAATWDVPRSFTGISVDTVPGVWPGVEK